MNPSEKEYDVIGELSEDGQFLYIHHWQLVSKILTKNLAGVKLEIVIRPLREKRSDKQNRYFWVCVIPTIRGWFKETQGVTLSSAIVYAWVKERLLGQVPVIKKVLGEDVILFKEIHLSKMSTKEFSDTVEIIIKEMAERGCIIPPPLRNNYMHEFLDPELDALENT